MADELEKSYEELRSDVIDKFRVIYKDALAMDACKVPKEVRIRMLEDPVYIAETKAVRANLFIDQLEMLDSIIAGNYDESEKGSDRSATVLRCIELKQKLLLEDLNVTKDESNALNVAFIAMSREDFEALETVEVNEGGNSRELSADFGVSEDTDSFEARLKADAKQRLKELEEKKEAEGNGNAS
jgi:hypothetical protein